MKNQPNSPIYFISFIIFMAAAFIFTAFNYNSGLGVVSIIITLIAAYLFIRWYKSINKMDKYTDESADIINNTWGEGGMDVRREVAELRYPNTGDGTWKWRVGWDLKRFKDTYGN